MKISDKRSKEQVFPSSYALVAQWIEQVDSTDKVGGPTPPEGTLDAEKSLEHTQKATKGGSLRGVPVNNTDIVPVGSLELLNNFRTSKNPVSTVRFDHSYLKSGGLLRE